MAWQPRSKNKFGAERVITDGYAFHSKLESSVYTMLKARENAGEIKILQHQDHIRFFNRNKLLYVPDFKCLKLKDGTNFWVEAKGYEDPKWGWKKELWLICGPGPLEIYRGTHLRPFLDEVITPERNNNETIKGNDRQEHSD